MPLTLRRGIDESVLIGNDVKVTVIGVKGKRVWLSFEAPMNVPIFREEVYLARKKALIEETDKLKSKEKLISLGALDVDLLAHKNVEIIVHPKGELDGK